MRKGKYANEENHNMQIILNTAHPLERVLAPAPWPSNNYAILHAGAATVKKMLILHEVDEGLEGCEDADSLCNEGSSEATIKRRSGSPIWM